MLDSKGLRADLNTAIENLADELSQLLADKIENQETSEDYDLDVAAPTSGSTPASPPVDAARRLPTPPLAPDPDDELARLVVELVSASPIPPTFRRLRETLRCRARVLSPVVDRLVADGRICAVPLADVILYELP